MRARLQFLALALLLAGLANAQCLSVSYTSSLNEVTYYVWKPVTSMGAPCGSGDLVIYAHGYVTPVASADSWMSELTVGGVSLPAVLNQAGYAVAASTYSKTGLAIVEGTQNTLALAHAAQNPGLPDLPLPPHIYLIGASEGGLVTTLSAEQDHGAYNSAGAACGPIGSFQAQLNYFGDFRVLFDYFFPGVIPGSPVSAADTQGAAALWGTLSAVAIPQAISDVSKTQQLFRVMGIAMPSTQATVLSTVLEILAYNIFGTADAQQELGGQPYDNSTRIYIDRKSVV